MEIRSLIKRRKSSRTKHLFKKLKRKYHHKNFMSSDMTLVDKNGSSVVLNNEAQELFIKKVEDRLNIPIFDKINNDLLNTNQKYEQILKINKAIQISLDEIIDKQDCSFENIKKVEKQQNIQTNELKIQSKIINEQQSIIKELLARNKDYESRLEKTENILYEHQKKFIEIQNIIENNKSLDIVNNSDDLKENKSKKLYNLSPIEEETSGSLSSIKFKYLINEFLEKIEHCEKQEKNCEEHVEKLLNQRRDETKKIHKIFEEIQQRINIFGIKKYDDIIEALNQYKKYIDIPMHELIEIEKLDLSKKHIYTIADGFSILNNIKHLNLMDNYLSQFPMELTKMTNLVEINLSYNDIITIPSEIKQLTNLEKLSISNNSLTSIPKEICYLTKLFSLNLSNNRIRKIPNELYSLKKLKWVFLNNNLIEEISKSLLSDLPNLEIFYIGNNKIKQITEEQKNSKKILGLEDNSSVDSVPRQFFNINNIESIK